MDAVTLTYRWNGTRRCVRLAQSRNRNAYEYYGRLAIARDATGISASCSRDSIGAAILTLEENHIPPDLEPQTITIQKAAAE